jgi:hypothetical protein
MSKSILRIAFISALLMGSALGQSTNGLVLSYPLANSTGVLVSDESPLANNGTLMGAAYLDTDPVVGVAANFYGPTGLIATPFSSSLEPRTGTLRISIKVNEYQNASFISHFTDLMVNHSIKGTFAAYDLHMDGNGRFIGCIADDGNVTMFRCVSTPPKTVQLNKWQQVALRWDGRMVALFVDGKLQDARSYSAIPALGLSYHGSYPLYVAMKVAWGRAQAGSTFPEYAEFIGEAANIQLYSRPLTDAELGQSASSPVKK